MYKELKNAEGKIGKYAKAIDQIRSKQKYQEIQVNFVFPFLYLASSSVTHLDGYELMELSIMFTLFIWIFALYRCLTVLSRTIRIFLEPIPKVFGFGSQH